MKVTVFLRDSAQVGRVEVVKVRDDGVQGLKDDIPNAMVSNLRSHWETMGWAVVDERREGGR